MCYCLVGIRYTFLLIYCERITVEGQAFNECRATNCELRMAVLQLYWKVRGQVTFVLLQIGQSRWKRACWLHRQPAAVSTVHSPAVLNILMDFL